MSAIMLPFIILDDLSKMMHPKMSYATCKLMTDKLIAFMLLFLSFPSCLLAISITKTHNFMIIGCSPASNYTFQKKNSDCI